MPIISVIMAMHNGLPYLYAAIDSVLNQTYDDFELIVVDDASSDGSLKILQAYHDKRIKLLKNIKQKGLSQSLNRGLAAARGKYIARMDHDDISLPQRLLTQKEYLDLHAQVDVVGSWAKIIGGNPEMIWRPPANDGEIRSELIFNPSLVHSSVMFRRQAGLRYNPDIVRAQDYDLWCRVAGKVRFANIEQVLLCYRIHARQVGKQKASEQIQIADQIRAKRLRTLGLQPTKKQLRLHHRISRWRFAGDEHGLIAIGRWLNLLGKSAKFKSRAENETFRKALAIRWLAACRGSIQLGSTTWILFQKNELSRFVSFRNKAILWVKCLSRQWGWRTG